MVWRLGGMLKQVFYVVAEGSLLVMLIFVGV
jgi:hypothetical protein